MNRTPSIQKRSALFLLLVFALSIAPKAYFHDLIARHNDGTGCRLHHDSAALHTQGYHCHFDDLVVSAPFQLTADAPTPAALSAPVPRFYDLYSGPLAALPAAHDNRGPPTA